jgi:hypothetical protein
MNIVNMDEKRLLALNERYVRSINEIISKVEEGEEQNFKLNFLYRLRRQLTDTKDRTKFDSLQMNLAREVLKKYNKMEEM